jgi:predicted PurR-regulated permease PerM
MWAASRAALSVLWTAEWMAVLMAWALAAWVGHHWADPLALAMVVKTAAERVVLWARKKVEKWDVYLA